MRFGFFFHEAVRALTKNAVPSFAAMATVLVTVLVLGVFIPVVQATTGAANEVRSRVIADVYLQPRVTDAEIAKVRGIITNETPHVARVEYIPKEKAIAAERKAGRGEYYDLLGANPLPDTFRVYPDKPDNITKIRNALAPLSPSGGRTVIDPAIDEVRNREEDTNKILSATRVVKITMALLAALLCVASILLIANTIRLSLYARRREVEVMKLVGATDWFIRWPFVLEGVLVGAIGGVMAILLLGVVKIALVDPLAARVRADRRAGHDQLRRPYRGVAGRVRRGVGDRLRPVAAPLPARVAPSRARTARPARALPSPRAGTTRTSGTRGCRPGRARVAPRPRGRGHARRGGAHPLAADRPWRPGSAAAAGRQRSAVRGLMTGSSGGCPPRYAST